MELNVSLVDILKISVIVAAIIAFFIPKKSDYEYTSLDKKGSVLNAILSFMYIPLSIMGIFTVFFADAPMTNYSEFKILLLNTIIWLGFSIPFLSIVGIFTSVVARKRGRSKFSFIIQFLPLPVFALMLILIFFMFKA